MLDAIDSDYGMLVRSHLLSLGLENVVKEKHTFQYTDSERKAVIANALKQIYNIIGTHDTPEINNLANQIYKNYAGSSYRNFPRLSQLYDLEGAINSIDKSCVEKISVIDESNWTNKIDLYLIPEEFIALDRSISRDDLRKIFKFFTSRPITNLDLVSRQIEETIKLRYEPKHQLKIKLRITR